MKPWGDEPAGEPPLDSAAAPKSVSAAEFLAQSAAPAAEVEPAVFDVEEFKASAAAASEVLAAAEPTLAWGTRSATATIMAMGAPGGEPRSPGQATVDEPEEEDPWLPPVGFEDLKAKDDTVFAPAKFQIPGADGVPLKDASTSIYAPDDATVMMMQSFDADPTKEKVPIHNGVTAQLTLQDLTMDVVELHTEQFSLPSSAVLSLMLSASRMNAFKCSGSSQDPLK